MATGGTDHSFEALLTKRVSGDASHLTLEDGDRVAVIGGGPSGTFMSHFMLRMASQIDLDIDVDIYEPRHFTHTGSGGCNHCGGIVSESLVQMLATEGITLPNHVVQRAIDSYMLHMDVGRVRIDTPLYEKRIAAVYRGNGPTGADAVEVSGFDHYLLELARREGARIIHKLVNRIAHGADGCRVSCSDGTSADYQFAVVATGVNSHLIDLIADQVPGFEPPGKARTYICEFNLGREAVAQHLGTSMHVFLLDLPHLEFAALIPKGDYVTACLLGEIDEQLLETFFASNEVRTCFPHDFVPPIICHCFPRLNLTAARQPFADRIVMLGDCGVTRLYKDGIGAAYRTAKVAASTVIHHGIAEEDFRTYLWPTLRMVNFDNFLGKLIFAVTHGIQKLRFTRRAVLRLTSLEQQETGAHRHLSSILWDLFTGSAPYRDVFVRAFHPVFLARLVWNLLVALWQREPAPAMEEQSDAGANLR